MKRPHPWRACRGPAELHPGGDGRSRGPGGSTADPRPAEALPGVSRQAACPNAAARVDVVDSAAMPAKLLFFVVPFVLGYAVDQMTKQWVIHGIPMYGLETVIPGVFDLTHVRNPGGAWSLLAGGDAAYRMPFFIGAGVVAVGLLLYFYSRLEPDMKLSAAALGAVLGGALGNLTDRLRHGEVIDFLQVHLPGYTWPTFNVADSLVVVGVIVLMIETFFEPDPGPDPEPGDGDASDARVADEPAGGSAR